MRKPYAIICSEGRRFLVISRYMYMSRHMKIPGVPFKRCRSALRTAWPVDTFTSLALLMS
jgi:hypothetical protein